MEIRKTTLLSFLVCIAGILAEVMFRDVLAKSAFGVVLSVLLAVVIIALAYFFYDGFCSFLTAEREMDKKRQEEYDQKLYAILNEQLQFEKAIYKEVHVLMQESEEAGRADSISIGALEERLNRLEASVNEHTTTTAKIVSKYVNSNMDETRALFEQNKNDLQDMAGSQEVLDQIKEEIQVLLGEKDVLKQMQEDIQAVLEGKAVMEQTQGSLQELLESKAVMQQIQAGLQELLEGKAVIGQMQDKVQSEMQALVDKQDALEQVQADIQSALADRTALEQRQEDVRKLVELQKEFVKVQRAIQRRLESRPEIPELGQMQSDIQAVMKSEDELKQKQGEMQSSIRKLAEIMTVLLTLLRKKKPDAEKQ